MKARMANEYVRMVSSSASRRTCLVVGSYAKKIHFWIDYVNPDPFIIK